MSWRAGARGGLSIGILVRGIGGVGKTRLSLQVAAELLGEFEHGAWFVELAGLGEAGLLADTIADTFDGVEVAPWELFGIGGTNTVRGWEFAARQGKNQMINTLEYRYTLFKPTGWNLPLGIKYRGGLSLAAFADWGLGWDEGPEFAANNFIDGYGVGLRLLLPIVGVARFDVAWGDPGKSVFFHLGSFEKATFARRRVR